MSEHTSMIVGVEEKTKPERINLALESLALAARRLRTAQAEVYRLRVEFENSDEELHHARVSYSYALSEVEKLVTD